MTNTELRRLVLELRRKIHGLEKKLSEFGAIDHLRSQVLNDICNRSDYQKGLIRDLKRECMRLRFKLVMPEVLLEDALKVEVENVPVVD